MTRKQVHEQVTIDPVEVQVLVKFYYSTNGDKWYVNDNWLTGPVDTWYGVQVVIGHVVGLNLSWNNLTGFTPADIGDLTHLQYSNRSGNQISENIPAEIGNLTSLFSLDLSWNNLWGQHFQ